MLEYTLYQPRKPALHTELTDFRCENKAV